jgi:ABC-type lipoprotein release transport system permease subunit
VVLVRILMSKSGFEDEVIKLIVGVVKHVTIDELGPVDYRGSNRFL